MTDTLRPLTTRERQALRALCAYYRADVSEYLGPPPIRYLERRLQVSRAYARELLESLHRKGWLQTPTTAGVRCPHL